MQSCLLFVQAVCQVWQDILVHNQPGASPTQDTLLVWSVLHLILHVDWRISAAGIPSTAEWGLELRWSTLPCVSLSMLAVLAAVNSGMVFEVSLSSFQAGGCGELGGAAWGGRSGGLEYYPSSTHHSAQVAPIVTPLPMAANNAGGFKPSGYFC